MKKILVLVMAAAVSQLASAATAEEDVAHYIEAVQISKSDRFQALEELAWKGISDPRVFDPVEKIVLAELESGSSGTDRAAVDQALRGLSFSGQSKYLATLQKAAADSRFSRHAKIAMAELPNYARWNPIISDRSKWDAKYSDDDNRLLNMLHSNDLVLKRIAGKRVYFENKDPVVLEAMAAEVKAELRNRHSGDEADGLNWMMKALGSTKQAQYRALLIQVAEESVDLGAQSYAKRVLGNYSRYH